MLVSRCCARSCVWLHWVSNQSNMTLLIYVSHLSNCFCVSCTSCVFFLSVFENNRVTIIPFNRLLFLLICEQHWGTLILRLGVCLDSVHRGFAPSHVLFLPHSGRSFDIGGVFLLPVWQPEALKPPFLNILKRTTHSRLPELHASCWHCCTPLHPWKQHLG